jgi:F-type H+-transporting ATPase subunit b
MKCRSLRMQAFLPGVLMGSFFLGYQAHAQPQNQTAASGQAVADSEREHSGKRDSLPAQLAKESREAAGEDDTDAFKHSASVQLVAKWTGLSLEHAYWLCIVLNFAVVAGLIGWLLQKNLPGVFRNRTAAIQQALEEARKAGADASRRLAEIEARLSRLDLEIGQMQAAAEKDAAAEELRIKAAAAEDARKVVEAAEFEIAAAAKAARRELTAFAADLAVSLAEKQIRVDTLTDQALVRDFAAQLSTESSGRKDGR